MTTKVSVAQAVNAANHTGSYAVLFQSIQADLAALAAALVALTGQLDTNTVTGHPYTKTANNPVLNTTP